MFQKLPFLRPQQTTMSYTCTSTKPSPLPTIHLLCMEPIHITAFNAAAKTYSLPSSINLQIHHERLADLPQNNSLRFECIVSPANSYARLDGGFDDALSRVFSPKGDYMALTRVAQERVWKEWRGFAPPGSCTMVDLAASDAEGETKLMGNGWGCRYMALVPTMKIPQRVLWDREVVYECMWALFNSVDKHNREFEEGNGDGKHVKIEGVLLTPFATGCGDWSAEKWAAQLVLAIRHFVEAAEDEQGWAREGFVAIMEHHTELMDTYNL